MIKNREKTLYQRYAKYMPGIEVLKAKGSGQDKDEICMELLQHYSNVTPENELLLVGQNVDREWMEKVHQGYISDTSEIGLIFPEVSFMCCVASKLL